MVNQSPLQKCRPEPLSITLVATFVETFIGKRAIRQR